MMENKVMSQREFIRKYNEEHREDFNDDLFVRDNDRFIEALKKVILSCERDRYFILKVKQFTVVDSYEEIIRLLKEQEKIKSDHKDKYVNRYDYIAVQDSDIRLLVVDWYMWVPNPKKDKDGNEGPHDKTLRVLIMVPRYVDKYYLRLFGTLYCQKYQIVDGSTYNNSQKENAKSQNVTLKTIFMATRIYRFKQEFLTTRGDKLPCIFYMSAIFNKMVPVMKYLLARFGLYETMDRLGVPYLRITDHDINDDEWYTVNVHQVYLSLPKYIYENDITAQSLMYTIYNAVVAETTVDELFTVKYWVDNLGASFNSKDPNKGESVLFSLENIYDLLTKESIRLPENQKKDIYDILVWIIREFSELRKKDNLDIGAKRIRLEDYAAMLYAMKLSVGLFRISDNGADTQLSEIEKSIFTFPDYLIKVLTRDRLVNSKNSVNDLDCFSALKCTYKGVSGIGENKDNSVAIEYRQVNTSQLGRIDLDSSSANDPGLSGMLCPMSDMYDNYFSDYSEPNTWREELRGMLKEYKKQQGLKEVYTLQRSIGMPVDAAKEIMVDENLARTNMIMPFIIGVDESMIDISPVKR